MKTTLGIFFVLTLLLLADILLYYFAAISLAGYYSDVILFWLWLISSLTVIILFWNKFLAKLFLLSFFVAFILSIVAMAIPFTSFVLAMTGAGLYKTKSLNKNYRAQIVGYSAMGRPQLEIIERLGLFERRRFVLQDREFEDLYPNMTISRSKEIFPGEETDSTLSLFVFYGGPNFLVTFDKNSGKLVEVKQRNPD